MLLQIIATIALNLPDRFTVKEIRLGIRALGVLDFVFDVVGWMTWSHRAQSFPVPQPTHMCEGGTLGSFPFATRSLAANRSADLSRVNGIKAFLWQQPNGLPTAP
jgi:hypothetical protein